MSVLEIIGGVMLLIACIFIILVTLLQENKQQGMTSAVGGGSNDSFYGRNSSRTREAKLIKITRAMAITFFVVTILVNLLPPLFK